MPSSPPSTLPRLAALAIAIAATCTSALLWHRTTSASTACNVNGGCDVVQGSAYAHALGVPLPVWGMLAFGTAAVLLGLTRSDSPRMRSALRLALMVGAVAGTALLCVQAFILHAWCPFCVVIDLAAIALGSLAAFTRLAPVPSTASRLRRLLIPAAVGVLPALVLNLVFVAPPPASAPAPQFAAAPRDDGTVGGIVQIVEYVDLECPFCRTQHARLAEVLAQLPDLAIEVIVRHLPIATHAQAKHAAAVACCGEAQGQGTAVLDALMRADDLSPAGCRREAERAGVDLHALDACLDSTVVAERLDRDRQAARDLGVRALPTCVIGGHPFTGLQSAQALRDAIVQAANADAATQDCASSSETI